MNVSDYIIKFFYRKGAKTFFLLPGGGNMYLIDSVKKNNFNYLSFNHEQAAVIAAEGYTRIQNGIGVAIVTSGPGGTNSITGIAGSWLDSLPLIVISGQVKTSDLKKRNLRQNGPQELPIIEIVKPITKHAIQLNHNSNIDYEINKALSIATNGRKGPVLIDVPLDIQSKSYISEIKKIYSPVKKLTFKNNLFKKVFNKIKNSSRPLLFIGHGTRLSNSKKDFLKFISNYNIPCVFTWNAKDLLSYNHKLNLGSPGVVAKRFSNFAVQNCDLIIFLGSRLNLINSAFNKKKFAKNANKIFVDIDKTELDTDKLKNSININTDVKYFFNKLNSKKMNKNAFNKWIKFCNNQKNFFEKEKFSTIRQNDCINHYDLMHKFSNLFKENDIIVTGSSGLAIEIFYTYFKNKTNQRIFLTTALGSMGYGLPSAIGAASKTNKKTILIESDGSFLFNIQELATIKTYKLPICIFLLNNKGYASIRNTQKSYFKSRFVGTGSEDKMFYPNFKNIAKSFEINYFKVKKLKDLDFNYKKFIKNPIPTIIDIHLEKNATLLPKVSAVFKGSKIYSLPLEDMSPLLSLDELKKNVLNKINQISIDVRK